MPIIESNVIPDSASFAANRAAHLELIAEFRGLERRVAETSARGAAKFRERKQLLPRERINMLVDRDAPFLELSSLAGLGMHEDDGVDNVYGGSIVAGIGFVSGVRCMIQASDSGIKGGANHPMGTEKLLRIQTIAMENKLPLVQLVESAGANLLLQSELFVFGGAIFANMAKLSAAGIPVVSIVHGSSTAGGAYQTGLADYVILIRDRSKVFLAGPPLLRAATGEIADDESLGGAEMHSSVTGLGEYLAEDDRDAMRIARELFEKIATAHKPAPQTAKSPLPPRYPAEDLLGVVSVDYRKPYDVREVIARIVDDSCFLEFKADWGSYTVCGHADIDGKSVGILGNNGPIDAAGAAKAAHFIQFCCQLNVPLLFLQNTTGFIVGVEAERRGIVKHGSKMIQAVTNATVPKITIQIGASFGAGHYAMCGRAFGPRFVFSWPNNRLSVMGGEQAAKVLTIVGEASAERRGKRPDKAALDAQAQHIIKTYDHESRALFGTARLWDDGIIDPRDTRAIVAFCLDTCLQGDQKILRPNTFGIARM
jgi:geranyl-CoA carboxylase beta subunit